MLEAPVLSVVVNCQNADPEVIAQELPLTYKLVNQFGSALPVRVADTAPPHIRDYHYLHAGLAGRQIDSGSPLTTDPGRYREFRDQLFRARRAGGTIHLFGTTDRRSHYGSMRQLEATLRDLMASGVSVAVYAGAYTATPREHRRGIDEIRQLAALSSRVRFAGAVSVGVLASPSNPWGIPLGSVDGVGVVDGANIGDSDIIVVAASLPSGWPTVLDRFVGETSIPVVYYWRSESHPTVYAGHGGKHILVATDGSDATGYYEMAPDDPYLEVLRTVDADTLFALMASPHWGYNALPALTMVAVNELSRSYDAALAGTIDRWQAHGGRLTLVAAEPFTHRDWSVYYIPSVERRRYELPIASGLRQRPVAMPLADILPNIWQRVTL